MGQGFSNVFGKSPAKLEEYLQKNKGWILTRTYGHGNNILHVAAKQFYSDVNSELLRVDVQEYDGDFDFEIFRDSVNKLELLCRYINVEKKNKSGMCDNARTVQCNSFLAQKNPE